MLQIVQYLHKFYPEICPVNINLFIILHCQTFVFILCCKICGIIKSILSLPKSCHGHLRRCIYFYKYQIFFFFSIFSIPPPPFFYNTKQTLISEGKNKINKIQVHVKQLKISSIVSTEKLKFI